jgi:hypothetical protein
MARKVRSIRTAEFKAKLPLAAVGSQQTTAQLAAVHGGASDSDHAVEEAASGRGGGVLRGRDEGGG